MWSIQTTEYYLTLKRNKVLIHATTGMINLENLQPDTKGCASYDIIDVKLPGERYHRARKQRSVWDRGGAKSGGEGKMTLEGMRFCLGQWHCLGIRLC